ncbi:hypothetical protein C5167_016311 [Papaver somniferum]|uniref:uncharacterized protein LOC113332935 n=1 Tax=Papaver somniferum TaxID=3469 RepID=UPI000E6F51B8|nr:uncharacterized protein LOC113332935 [Papaver somniferum]RZC88501.1 hypothetical protein C5167_016311 [Papaver somniferum]
MALRISLISPKFNRKPSNIQTELSLLPPPNPMNRRSTFQVSCSKKKISDAEIAIDLATEIARIKIPAIQRKEAMNKSKELLFGEFCQYLSQKPEEVEQKWRDMDETEKMGLVKGFVSEWSLSFHPLSSRSVKDMLEEHLKKQVENPSVSLSSSPSLMFPSLKKILGMTQNGM